MNMPEYAQLTAIVIQTFVFVGGIISVVVRASSDSRQLRGEIKAMKEELVGLAKVITTQAVHTERLNNQSQRMLMLEQRVEDLRRGRGYVTERDQNRSVIDSEYP